jgi:hypothetical protein
VFFPPWLWTGFTGCPLNARRRSNLNGMLKKQPEKNPDALIKLFIQAGSTKSRLLFY